MKFDKRIRGKLDPLLRKYLGSHLSKGPLTLFGFNAMHVALEIRTSRFGYIVFHPSIGMLGDYVSWHIGSDNPTEFYLSPNGTPWASTFLLGKGYTKEEKIAALRRLILWGHNYDTYYHNPHEESEEFASYVFSRENKAA